MNKKNIDGFYETISKNSKYQMFAISLPLFLINKELTSRSEQLLKSIYGLLRTDIDVLAILYFRGKDYSLLPTQLYDALMFSSGGMTKILKKLEQKELINRLPVKLDKRKSLVSLTQKGVVTVEKIMNEKISTLNNNFSSLTNKEIEDLKSILSKILYSLKLD